MCTAKLLAAALQVMAGGRSGRMAFRGGRLRINREWDTAEWWDRRRCVFRIMEEIGIVCFQGLEGHIRTEQESVVSPKMYFLHLCLSGWRTPVLLTSSHQRGPSCAVWPLA